MGPSLDNSHKEDSKRLESPFRKEDDEVSDSDIEMTVVNVSPLHDHRR